MQRLFLIVLDSFGIGEMPDAADYGDSGSNTLAAVRRSERLHIPHMEDLGLFHIDGVVPSQAMPAPAASFARLAEQSAGKDTTTGHWEMAGLPLLKAFPTYPEGFPPALIERLEQELSRKILCNLPYSGTQVIADYGREHVKTGALIVYTSADSVLQIAAHEAVVPIDELYAICAKARGIMQGEHAVGRIIARPFEGQYPHFERTRNRHDYSLEPFGPTMLDSLSQAGLATIGIGKIGDIFAGRGLTRCLPTKSNAHGMDTTLSVMAEEFSGLCFVNLVDFDMLYGHRNDADGYAAALSEFDAYLPQMLESLREDDAVILTADHGCDPSTPSTDHSREYVPMLMFGPRVQAGVNLGTRATFADIAATVQAYFDLPVSTEGTSWLSQVL